MLWFCLTTLGPENSHHHPLNKSDNKLKQLVTYQLAFSRASSPALVCSLCSNWFPETFLIGFYDNFGFGQTTFEKQVNQCILLKFQILLTNKIRK